MVQNTVKFEDSFSGNQLQTVISGIAAAHCVIGLTQVKT
jgi:hypothetical protein